ncbi:MEDS domain-containing protein [Actinosynnema sp. NPDC023587]|uniref:MEDS domain-containing protein n=1 Tax=Actinosynnema sp. NPDC023587 TaxID=3154695 RepID=UPI0033FBA82A
MRKSGVVADARGLGVHDHVCWQYDDPADFRLRAREFLLDGLALGQRSVYLASGEVPALVEDLHGSPDLARALDDGSAEVASLDAVHPHGAVVDPAAQVRHYAQATGEALAAGFTGLRVAADCTSLVLTDDQLDAFARYEHLIDRYMATRPFSALCAYDSGRLDGRRIAHLACLHPNTNAELAGFRLHASGPEGTALGGEVDALTDELFTSALVHADLRPHEGRLVLDADELTFLDHNGLLRLAEHADDRDATLVLRTSWPGVARLAGALDLPNVHVERAA